MRFKLIYYRKILVQKHGSPVKSWGWGGVGFSECMYQYDPRFIVGGKKWGHTNFNFGACVNFAEVFGMKNYKNYNLSASTLGAPNVLFSLRPLGSEEPIICKSIFGKPCPRRASPRKRLRLPQVNGAQGTKPSKRPCSFNVLCIVDHFIWIV